MGPESHSCTTGAPDLHEPESPGRFHGEAGLALVLGSMSLPGLIEGKNGRQEGEQGQRSEGGNVCEG